MSFLAAEQQGLLYEEEWVLPLSVGQCLKQGKSHYRYTTVKLS